MPGRMRGITPAIVIVGLVVTALAGPGGTSQGSALASAIRAKLQQAKIPGAIVGVWRGGTQIYARGIGVADTATGQPMTADLHVRVGSVTKSFVVTAVLQLADEGKVGLGDPIGKYLPGVPGGNRITIRELAAMRSGLFSYSNLIVPKVVARDPARQWAPAELLRLGFGHRPLFAPGSQFDYSNTNTVLLGLVVEKVSGLSLSAYLERHILRPLHLSQTLLPRGAGLASPYAQGYTNWTPRGYSAPGGKLLNATGWNPSWGWAAGGMISTLDDLHKWARDLATGSLLTPAAQRQREQFRTAPGEGGATYGLGLMNYDGWIGHDGNIAGYITFPFYLPAEKTTLVVILNSNANVLGAVSVMRAITKIITPKHLWPEPPPE